REALTFSEDAGVDVDAARAVVAARRHVRDGMRLYARQSYAAAADHAERALALAPELPEAYKLAGDVRRVAGDAEAAGARYRRVLELGATTKDQEEEIRAYLGGP